MWIYSV
ncbi:alpha/beta hydrolase fold family protein, partial [Vibrio parahaemolyticus AQ3810]